MGHLLSGSEEGTRKHPPRTIQLKSRTLSWTKLQSEQNILLTKWNQEPRQTDLLIQSPSAKGKSRFQDGPASGDGQQ